jgi:hypothetical protein
MKLRINRDLHARARACAEAVGDSLSRWISLALRQYMCGKKLNDITPDPALLAADQDAMVITIPQLPAASPAIRRAIAAAVIYCGALGVFQDPIQHPFRHSRQYSCFGAAGFLPHVATPRGVH